MQRNKSSAVVLGSGSASCTMFKNGTTITACNGVIKQTDANGLVTVYQGSSYSTEKVPHEDGKNYDVVLKVKP